MDILALTRKNRSDPSLRLRRHRRSYRRRVSVAFGVTFFVSPAPLCRAAPCFVKQKNRTPLGRSIAAGIRAGCRGCLSIFAGIACHVLFQRRYP